MSASMNGPSRMPASKPSAARSRSSALGGRQQRLQQDRHHRRRHREAQQARRLSAAPARLFAGRGQFLVGRPDARQETLAGLGQADAARGAREQRSAQARLQRAHRLAHRRGADPERGRRLAEAALPGHGQEDLDAVQRALPHREVPLHASSRLSPLVARRWRP